MSNETLIRVDKEGLFMPSPPKSLPPSKILRSNNRQKKKLTNTSSVEASAAREGKDDKDQLISGDEQLAIKSNSFHVQERKVTTLLKSLDKNTRLKVIQNLKSIDSWEYLNTNPSISNFNPNISTAAVRAKARPKVEMLTPRQLHGMKKNAMSEKCKKMREKLQKRRLYAAMQVCI